MHENWLGSVVLCAACLVGRTALAAQPEPLMPPEKSQQAPREIGLGALEVIVGMGVGVGGIAGALSLGDPLASDGGAAQLAPIAVLLAVPALEGLAICGIGSLSPDYEGGCLWPIAGAYIGAAASVPLTFILSGDTEDPIGGAITAIIGLGLGLLIGAPVGATWAWNASKQRQGSDGADVPADPHVRGARPRAAAPLPETRWLGAAQRSMFELRLFSIQF